MVVQTKTAQLQSRLTRFTKIGSKNEKILKINRSIPVEIQFLIVITILVQSLKTICKAQKIESESSSIHVVDQARRYALLSFLPDELRSQLLNEEEKNCTCSSDSGADSKLQKSANGKLQESANLQKSANGHHVIKEHCLQDSITTKNKVQKRM